jgi:hypothetical protein
MRFERPLGFNFRFDNCRYNDYSAPVSSSSHKSSDSQMEAALFVAFMQIADAFGAQA